jgi:membrane associated rhomboid family serine protease
MNLLLVGPSAEHVFGSQAMLIIFIRVAIVSGIAHIPVVVVSIYTHQLGASGIVFCVILLNSLVGIDSGEIPLSFILTAGLWCTDEFIKILWKTDNMSHHAHITGAIVGTFAAYYYKGKDASNIAKHCTIRSKQLSSISSSTIRTLFAQQQQQQQNSTTDRESKLKSK